MTDLSGYLNETFEWSVSSSYHESGYIMVAGSTRNGTFGIVSFNIDLCEELKFTTFQ
jgi:hypothetical protein